MKTESAGTKPAQRPKKNRAHSREQFDHLYNEFMVFFSAPRTDHLSWYLDEDCEISPALRKQVKTMTKLCKALKREFREFEQPF